MIFVIGNGTSRKNVNLSILKKHGKVIGCNALYRNFTPDLLFTFDSDILHEIISSQYCIDNEVYVLNEISYLPEFAYERLDTNRWTTKSSIRFPVVEQTGEVEVLRKILPVISSMAPPLYLNDTTVVYRACPINITSRGNDFITVIGRNFRDSYTLIGRIESDSSSPTQLCENYHTSGSKISCSYTHLIGISCTCPNGTPTLFDGNAGTLCDTAEQVDCSACSTGYTLSEAAAAGTASTCNGNTCTPTQVTNSNKAATNAITGT